MSIIFRRGTVLAAIVLVVGGITAGAIPAQAENTSVSPGLYTIHNRKTGKCLALRGGGAQLGVPAIQATCVPGTVDQQWIVYANGQIENNKIGTGCLAIKGTSTHAGARVIHAKCVPPGADQFWVIDSPFGGAVRNTHSGLCVALAGGGAQNGAEALQTRCDTSGADQHWRFDEA